MNSIRLMFVLIMLFAPYALKKPGQRKIRFIDDDSLVILNGNVKQITEAPVDDINDNNPNAGQDYDIVDINKQGDVTKIVTGFHGSVFQTHYITKYNSNGKKLETKGYIKPADITVPGQRIKPKQIDTGRKLILVYRYNKQSEIINYVVNPNKPGADSSTYKYNNKGELIELDYYANPKLLMDVTKYKYDNNNNLIELDKFHWKKLMVKMRYEYKSFDLKNNWVDMIIHSELFLGASQVQDFGTHRKITYY